MTSNLADTTLRQRTVVQLLSPGTGGVRDYAEGLSRHWQASGMTDHLLSFSQEDARQRPLATRLKQLIETQGRPCTLLLHYSGYGFQARGICFWLLPQIDRARQCLGRDLRIVTVFHELFASGPPWGSAFWLSGVQAWIAAAIARRSDALWTNTELHRRWLADRVGRNVSVTMQPVFSTIGEPDIVPASNQRGLQLVVFGAQTTRHRALALLPRHAMLLRRHGVTEVIEVGSGQAYNGTPLRMNHRFVGRMAAPELQSLLQHSAYGLIDYPPKYLGKSTVFAAYAVHGCIALNTADTGMDTDGLRHGEHFVTLKNAASMPGTPQARQCMADAARAWYAGHRSRLQAEAFADVCQIHPIKEAMHA